jgi:hypothetical protein
MKQFAISLIAMLTLSDDSEKTEAQLKALIYFAHKKSSNQATNRGKSWYIICVAAESGRKTKMITISKTLILSSSVSAHHAGLGAYDMGETTIPGEEAGGFESVAEFHAYLLTDCGVSEIEVDKDADGKTYGQSGRTIYKMVTDAGETVRECHWLEEMEDDSTVLAIRQSYAV